MAIAQACELLAPFAQRAVEIDVRREQPRRHIVVPSLDEAVDRIARSEQPRVRPDDPPRQRGLARDQLERPPHRPLALRVREVGEQDHAQTELGHPAHQRAEPGQSARVPDVPLPVALVPDHEAVAVAPGDHAGRVSQRRPFDARRERAAGASHLAQRGAAHGSLLGRVARRLGAEEHPAPAGEVAHAAVEAAERREVAAVGQRHLRREAVAGLAVAGRDLLRRQIAGTPDRRAQAERLQHALAHDVLVALPGDRLDHAPERGPAVVGVLEGRAGSARARRPAREHLGAHPGVVVAHQAIRPGIVLRQSGVHRQQLAHCHGRRIRPGLGQLPQVGRDLIDRDVDIEPALVSQREHDHRDEALGHRADAEGRVGVGRGSRCEIAHAAAAGVHELAVDARRRTRCRERPARRSPRRSARR